MAKSSETKSKQSRNKKYMLVRYGRMSTLGLFEHHENSIPKVHTRVVVKTNRGLELGHLVGRLTCYRGGHFRFSQEQIKEYFDSSDPDFAQSQAGKFIRYATGICGRSPKKRWNRASGSSRKWDCR
jgi:hypothetical protein